MASEDLQWWLNAAGRYPIPDKQTQLHLARLVQQGFQAEATLSQQRAAHRARDRMITGNLRLIISQVMKYRPQVERPGCGITLSDLLQEGAIGLSTAVDKFDPSRGYAFSTYAYWWIRQAITRALATQSRIIRPSLPALDLARRWRAKPPEQTFDEFASTYPDPNYTPERIKAELERLEAVQVRSIDRLCRLQNEASNNGAIVDQLADDTPDPYGIIDAEVALSALEAALPDDLALVELKEEGASCKEIAHLIDTTASKAAFELERSKNRLRLVAAELGVAA